MSPDEAKRRKSIAYILRRRKRGRKVGANSGEVVKSWGEYSEVSFKPNAAYSNAARYLLIFLVPLMIAAPIIIIGFSQGAQDLVDREVPTVLWILLSVLTIVIVTTTVFSVAYIALAIARVVRSQSTHKTE